MNKLNYKILPFALIVLAFASFASAGNYRFQNTSGYDLMFMNGSSGNVGIGTTEVKNE